MRTLVLAALPGFNRRFEGRIHFMYCDVKNLVTVGDGNLVDPFSRALALPFTFADGTAASLTEITVEWTVVKTSRRSAKAQKPYAELFLSDKAIDDLCDHQAASNEVELRRHFTLYDALPADAQLLLHSMAWACGSAFANEFPKFTAAVNALDFKTAADECKMDATGNPGLVPRNKADLILARNAKFAIETGADPEVLNWPTDVVPEL